MALNNAQTKTNSSAFRLMLEKHQLTGPNFNEWFHALKLVVHTEKLQDVFEIALPPANAVGADAQALADWAVLFYRHNDIACLMLGTMSPKLYQHEVFETFKVFKSEVENQLEKTIKAIRYDRGGEYISQEFKDYLKACGIFQKLNYLYTPKQNGVSERHNRTLLNMVRSMMSLATLPLSFWDYALESVARILNMVPTKKVDKTLYELWHGKVPNLSYLKVWGYEAHVKRHTANKL
nr:retrotransposon protein, putative, Ty1-copia subclass [Tanacetum cinerariifolium]